MRTSAGLVDRAEAIYGRVLDLLAILACVLLFVMMLVICADVFLRNVQVIDALRGLPAANDISEYTLYLVTMFTAPWLLRRGQHIRVDILLRAIPPRIAWYCEWLTDIAAFACCVVLMVYGWRVTMASYAAGSMTIKSLITPEWWSLAPLPITFALLAIEVCFRMRRLASGERGPRHDAVSAG